jgi:mannose-6-phosphate isomerase-like protein (cupin superfamily)
VTIRRVATGHDDSGKAVFALDRDVEPVTLTLSPSTEYHLLWSSDGPEALPNSGMPPAWSTFFPPVDGYRFFILTLLPATGPLDFAKIDIGAGLREMDEKLPGLRDHSEPDNPGMHRTDTIDFEIVLSGEVTLELDDGAETVLHAGDVNIQSGTRHRWHNRTEQPATMACVLVGTARKSHAED